MANTRTKNYKLDDLQANILKFHNRRYGVYLFVHFKEGQRAHVRDRLAKAVANYVTSAQQQQDFASPLQAYRKHLNAHLSAKDKGQPSKAPRWPDTKGIVGFGLSYGGYVYLGLSDYVPGHEEADNSDLQWFKSSLGAPPNELVYRLRWNPEKENWDAEYRRHEIHALFILADDDLQRLQKTARDLKRALDTGVRILVHQETRRIIWQGHEYGKPLEHFGFRDGINKGPTPDHVLVKEPQLAALTSASQTESYGSFLAVLKLEQNVQKFRDEAENLAARFRAGGLAANITSREAEALAVGRLPAGQPLVSPNLPDDKLDNFDYSGDESGVACPFHAHIRKMNSRGLDPRTGVSRSSQILRRGMSYGNDREDLLKGIDQVAPSGGVGLMFTSFQQNLVDFVSLFHRAYNPKELDALIGRTLGQQEEAEPQTWVSSGSVVQHLMADFVTPRGGEYFFAPSMHLIRSMGTLFPSA